MSSLTTFILAVLIVTAIGIFVGKCIAFGMGSNEDPPM
jgi:hypothetical protein